MFCSICQKNTIFISHRDVPNRKCSDCKSLERHRNLFTYLENQNLIDNKKILHIGPEKCLINSLSSRSHTYICCDKNYQPDKKFMSKLDMIDMSIFTANYFDIIICFHVIEHIKHDTLAIEQTERILKQGGSLLLSVPICGEFTDIWTDEKIKLEIDNKSWGILGKYDGHHRTYGYKDLTVLLNKYFSAIEQSSEAMTSEQFFICKK